jgi:hypothetical protein
MTTPSITIISKLKDTYLECKNNDNTNCVLMSIKETSEYVAEKQVVKTLGLDRLEKVINIQDKVEKCIEKKHDPVSCSVGTLVNVGVTATTLYMSEKLIVSAPLIPNPVIGSVIGTIGVIGVSQSPKIGNSIGNLTVNLVDKIIKNTSSFSVLTDKIIDNLINNMPDNTTIDTKHPLVIENGKDKLVFSSTEIGLLNNIILSNKHVDKKSHELTAQVDHFSQTIDQQGFNFLNSINSYNEKTDQIKEKINNKLSDETFDLSFDNLDPLSTEKLSQGLPEYNLPAPNQYGKYVKVKGSNGSIVVSFVLFTIGSGGISFCSIL